MALETGFINEQYEGMYTPIELQMLSQMGEAPSGQKKTDFDLKHRKMMRDDNIKNGFSNMVLNPDEINELNFRYPDTGRGIAPVQGGFAFAPLIAGALPIIGPLIKDGISWLVKKIRGKGIRPVNYGAGFMDYFNQHKDELVEAENQLVGLRGREFWMKLSNILKHVFGDVVNDDALTHAVVKKLIPNSFQKTLSSAGSGKTDKRRTLASSLIGRPTKWTLRKMIRDDKGKDVYKRINFDNEINDIVGKDTFDRVNSGNKKALAQYLHGSSGGSWAGFKKTVKRILNKIIPVFSGVSKQLSKTAVKALMNKFGVKDAGLQNTISETVGNTAENLTRNFNIGEGMYLPNVPQTRTTRRRPSARGGKKKGQTGFEIKML